MLSPLSLAPPLQSWLETLSNQAMGGDKISTIILKVDLDCRKCYKKISKTICKLQERESIQTVKFDEKNNTVTISGPFDPKKLCKKLCCKACKVIKDIQIKEEEKPKPKEEKPKPKEEKPKEEKPKPKEEKPKEDKPKEEKPKEEKPKEVQPVPPATEPVKAEPVFVALEPEPRGPWPGPWCTCGCRPWYGGYYRDYKCPWCGRGYGWPQECPPPVIYAAPPPYPCGGYKTCTYICDDPQPSCSIM